MNDMNQTDQSIPVAVQSKLRDAISKTLAMREYVKRNNGGFTTKDGHQPMIPESQNIPGPVQSPEISTPVKD